MPYTTPAAIRLFTKITASRDDARLSALITRTEKMIERVTRLEFEISADSTRKFDASKNVDGLTLHLDKHLAVITTITNGDTSVFSTSKYVTEPRNDGPFRAIKLLGSKSISWSVTDDGDPEDAISIVGRWGFSVTPPDDVVQACIDWTFFLYRRSENQQDVPAVVRLPDGTLMMPQGSPRSVTEILKYYIGEKLAVMG